MLNHSSARADDRFNVDRVMPTARALGGLAAACVMACPGAAAAGVTPPDAVELQGREVSAVEEAAADARSGERIGASAAQLVVVRFGGRLRDAWRAELASTGARLVTPLSGTAWLVHARGASARRLAAYAARAPEVRAGFVLDGADKLEPGFPERGPVRVAVQTLSGEDGAAARGLVRDRGDPPGPATSVGPYRTQRVVLDAQAARALAADPGVVAVEREGTPRPLDERQGLLLADAALGPGPGPGYLAAHDAVVAGSGTYPFVVDVMDSAFADGTADPADPDLRVDGGPQAEDRVAYVRKATSDETDPPGVQGCDGHGTLNASILAGYAAGGETDAQGFRYGLGIAPRARIGGTTIFSCEGFFDAQGTTFRALAEAAYQTAGPGHVGARVGSNSWGDIDAAGAYDALAQEFDAIVRDAVPGVPGDQELVEVAAAGNEGPQSGSIASPGTAKNVITVGASENVRPFGQDRCLTPDAEADDAQDVPSFTSRGPTDDGRRKPELVAPGTHVAGRIWRATGSPFDGTGVCGTRPDRWGAPFPDAGGYTASSGTSHATPAVAALAAAARMAHRRERGTWPSAAMVKALLVDGATPLGGEGAGAAPNDVQGFGLARLGGARTTGRDLSDQDVVLRDTGDVVWREQQVADPARPVTATLVWTDAPGPLVGAPQVNDLDLEVLAGGDVFRGNALENGRSVPGGAADRRNNVERVVLPPGTRGPAVVRVKAATIAGDGVPGGDPTDQDFALVLGNLESLEGSGWYGVPAPWQPDPPPAEPATPTEPEAAAVAPTAAPAPAPAATVPAPTAPAPTAPAPTAPAPTAGGRAPRLRVTGAPSSRRCLRVARVSLRVKAPPGVRLRSVSVLVNRRLRVRKKGARIASVMRVRVRAGRAYTLRVVARSTAGPTLRWERSYRACARAPVSGGATAPGG